MSWAKIKTCKCKLAFHAALHWVASIQSKYGTLHCTKCFALHSVALIWHGLILDQNTGDCTVHNMCTIMNCSAPRADMSWSWIKTWGGQEAAAPQCRHLQPSFHMAWFNISIFHKVQFNWSWKLKHNLKQLFSLAASFSLFIPQESHRKKSERKSVLQVEWY